MTHPDRIARGLYWDRAWSLVDGCTPVSEGCKHCWAAQASSMRACQKNPKIKARYEGLTEGNPPRFTGTIRLQSESLLVPQRTKKPTTFSVWNDLFHNEVPFEFIDEAFGVMAKCPQHTFIVLTKREERMWEYFAGGEPGIFPYENVILGVTVENNKHRDRIDGLLQIPAAVHFVSVEPMLGPLDVSYHFPDWDMPGDSPEYTPGIDWVICGAETGPGKRFMKTEWARGLRDQCIEADVPFFFKKDSGGSRLLHGREWNEMPEIGGDTR